MSCPQPAGNPSFKYSSKPLHVVPRKIGGVGNQSSVHQCCVLPADGAPATPVPDEEKSRRDKRASINSQWSTRSRDSSTSGRRSPSASSMGSLGSGGRPVRTSVSQGPEGLMITQMMTVGPSRTRKPSSLAVMPEDDEESGVSSSELNAARPTSSQQSSRPDSVFQTDESISPEPPLVIVTCDEDGTDIDEVSLQKLEGLVETCARPIPLQETDV